MPVVKTFPVAVPTLRVIAVGGVVSTKTAAVRRVELLPALSVAVRFQ